MEADGSRRAEVPLVAAAVLAIRDLTTELDLLDHLAAERLAVGRSDLRCLDVLSRRGPLTAGSLASSVRLSAPALSAALRRLEQAGYVQRARDPDDLRSVTVQITASAKSKSEHIYGELLKASSTALTARSASELNAVISALADVTHAVREIISAQPR